MTLSAQRQSRTGPEVRLQAGGPAAAVAARPYTHNGRTLLSTHSVENSGVSSAASSITPTELRSADLRPRLNQPNPLYSVQEFGRSAGLVIARARGTRLAAPYRWYDGPDRRPGAFRVLRTGGRLEHVGNDLRLLQRRSVRSGSERRLRRPRCDRAA
jgi:hypothetical protein